jgi:hypothetical protein
VGKNEDLSQLINKEDDTRLEFIYNAIQDVQETIRFTDTKSGTIIVLGTALIAAIVTLIDKYITLMSKLGNISKIVLIIGFILFCISLLVAIILSLKSINPSNNPEEHIELGDLKYKPKIKYYLSELFPSMRLRDFLFESEDSKFSVTARQYNELLINCSSNDLQNSLVFELLKLSYIREKKLKRTKYSLKWIEICIWIAVATSILVLATTNINFKRANMSIDGAKAITGLLVGYFFARMLVVFLKFDKSQLNRWTNILFSNAVHTLVIYGVMFVLSDVSLISLIIIFLFYLLIDSIMSMILLDNQSKQIDYKLFFTLDDLLRISILVIITLLKL